MTVSTTADLADLLASLPAVPGGSPMSAAAPEPAPTPAPAAESEPAPWEGGGLLSSVMGTPVEPPAPAPAAPTAIDAALDVNALLGGLTASAPLQPVASIATEPVPEPAPVIKSTPVAEPPPPIDLAQPEPPQPVKQGLRLQVYVDPVQLKRDVAFDLTQLDEAIRNHASLSVHYAVQAASARRQFELAKAQTEVIEAKLYAELRGAGAADGKKITEAQLDAALKGDPRWFAAQERLIEARHIHELANSARDAFDARKDMLIQVSVDRRTEHQGELRIRAANEAAQVGAQVRANAVNAARGLATA